jgi:hypothetical protein
MDQVALPALADDDWRTGDKLDLQVESSGYPFHEAERWIGTPEFDLRYLAVADANGVAKLHLCDPEPPSGVPAKLGERDPDRHTASEPVDALLRITTQ